MPLGGAEKTSGYKGYGLAMLVEIFCGISAGATYGPNIRRWMDTKRKADLGQCFIAIDPDCFAPGFQTRMSDLMTYLRNMEPVTILSFSNNYMQRNKSLSYNFILSGGVWQACSDSGRS